MPATEETWRNQKLMHVIFGVSSVVLLLSTLWMFAKDHNREWKKYQRDGREIQQRLIAWQKYQFETDEATRKYKQLGEALITAQLKLPPADLLDAFKGEVQTQREAFDFSDLDRKYSELGAAIQTATTARQAAAVRPMHEQGASDAASDVEVSGPEEAGDDPTGSNLGETAVDEAVERRGNWIQLLQDIIDHTKAQENESLRQRKFKAGKYDAAKANLGLGIRDNRPQEVLDDLQNKVSQAQRLVTERNKAYEDANTHRKSLQAMLGAMTAEETEARKSLQAIESEKDQLDELAEEKRSTYFSRGFPPLGKKWLELPIFDAFNSPLEVDNFHYPDLTVDMNFKRVARYDRCTTCHRGIDQASLANPQKAAFLGEVELEFTMDTPPDRPERQPGEEGNPLALLLHREYGLRLVSSESGGLVNQSDVTITFVRPLSRAAGASWYNPAWGEEDVYGGDLSRAAAQAGPPVHGQPEQGLQVGDVILSINGNEVSDQILVNRFLLKTADWGKPVRVRIRRGLPQPYSSHPRLDLFVGSSSPHNLQDFGCTSCHEGQGSSTTVRWASHTPNDLDQRKSWRLDHGWFNNHHWIFPMYPRRFAEASCLKCHHEVTELGAGQRYPDPPAPKVSGGHQLIRSVGCFGCHEINGYDGPRTRVGPDLRLEPNYFASALELEFQAKRRIGHFQQLKTGLDAGDEAIKEIDHRIGDLQNAVDWAHQIGIDPEDSVEQRHRVAELIQLDGKRSVEDKLGNTFAPRSHQLGSSLKDVEAPGKLRKVGPSLRYVGNKLDEKFLYDWVRQPDHFRPGTKMPQFFGLRDHLHGDVRSTSEQLEPVEIRGIVTYLLKYSQPFEPLVPGDNPASASPDERIARGKLLFETRGCLACHSHKDFPDAHRSHDNEQLGQFQHAPDLSAIGDKLAADRNPNGPAWLYSWLRDPGRYHVRTGMPYTFLEPIEGEDGEFTDPAEDIAEYLLAGRSDWQPVAAASASVDVGALDTLVLEHLNKAFFSIFAQRYVEQGIPEAMRGELKGAEVELVGDASTGAKLLYVGRKAIAKYGCYGCHDIPGYEDAKPIGTSLTDWGRKDPSKLDFAHILHYLDSHGGHGAAGNGSEHSHDDHGQGVAQASPELDRYFVKDISEHGRAGFAMQKLREPRSYDFGNVANKGYNERLRMPQFPLDATQREAIVTFVLGLVAEPPVARYVYNPDARARAILEGQQVLEKYNCGGCHMLEPEQWKIAYTQDDFRPQPSSETYPFLLRHHEQQQVDQSALTDARDRMHATLVGLPAIRDSDALPIVLDEEGDEVEEDEQYDPLTVSYRFDLWEPVLLAGRPYSVGVVPLEVPGRVIESKYPARGGDLTSLLLTRVVELEKKLNPQVKGSEARSWLPPPLVGQGRKVQAEWLHEFLLDPHLIRPAVFLRMPRFNMSAEEATKLVNYFAARDNARYPYEFQEQTRDQYVAAADAAFRQRLDPGNANRSDADPGERFEHAMKIVTDNNYCIKCHLVGDFEPAGRDREKAPDLSAVFKRLRYDYIHRWIANPKRILPYSSMPVNIPYDPDAPHMGGVSQDLYQGTSEQQLDALVDLLMNFDVYTKNRSPIAPLVKPVAPDDAGEGG